MKFNKILVLFCTSYLCLSAWPILMLADSNSDQGSFTGIIPHVSSWNVVFESESVFAITESEMEEIYDSERLCCAIHH